MGEHLLYAVAAAVFVEGLKYAAVETIKTIREKRKIR